MIEIERKYLVKNLDFVKYGVPHRIKQGYISVEDGRVVRIRIKDQKGYITLKSASQGFACHEFEYEIPVSDAQLMLDKMCHKPIIDKTRFDLLHKGKKWEIDVFNGENEGLIIAEIELQSKDEEFKIPPFIDREVTDDHRYYNAYIAEHPFCTWK
ncbi:MAG: CYTH domain-containing protein [Porphyromonadaceae bacterium]|nr:CYTH domain-containing protein [Porphyromonadaceae bacterium]